MSLPLTLADGKELTISIAPSRKARRLRLVSGLSGVKAVVPINYNMTELASFVESKKDWIIKTSQYYGKLKERCGELEPSTIYFLGAKYQFNVVKDRRASVVVSDAMKLITFHVLDRRMHKRYIEQWYREQTSKIIAERLPPLAGKLNLQYNKVSVKKQKSRWASCSKKKNLNFNLLLAAAPVEVIDYVILHELMHIVEFGHSQKFWQLVGSADPDYKKHREWLADHAHVIKID